MSRHVVNYSSVASLVLCVAVIALWVRSLSHDDRLWAYGAEPRRLEAGEWLIGSSAGEFFAEHDRYAYHDVPEFSWRVGTWGGHRVRFRSLGLAYAFPKAVDTGSTWRKLGFGAYESTDSNPAVLVRQKAVRAPSWALALILMIPPVARLPILLRGVRSWRRRRAGLCPVCGYDLRGSAERCPECGTPVEKVSALR